MNVPIVKITVDGMRHEIATALTKYMAQMDSDFQDAIKQCCEEFDIREQISQQLPGIFREILQRTLENAIMRFKYDQVLIDHLTETLRRSLDPGADSE
jgi:hypothetical protein